MRLRLALMTLFVVPVVFNFLAKNTGSPETVSRLLNTLQTKYTEATAAPALASSGSDTRVLNLRRDDL
jgi:multidrug efflux pump